jgi:hypothetical protein
MLSPNRQHIFGPSDDRLVLGNWSFLKDYQAHADAFHDLFHITHRVAEHALSVAPTPEDCAQLLASVLLRTRLFTYILGRKLHLPPSLYESMAGRMARYIVVENWAGLSQQSKAH